MVEYERTELIGRTARDLGIWEDAGQRARLLEMAERCPVHRTLTSEISIRTRLTPPSPPAP